MADGSVMWPLRFLLLLPLFVLLSSSWLVRAAKDTTSPAPSLQPENSCYCELSGSVDDCCCSVENVDEVRRKIVPIVNQLMQRNYFKFYKVNLFRGCPFWPEDGECGTGTCGVKQCTSAELPKGIQELEEQGISCEEQQDFGVLKDTIKDADSAQFRRWQSYDDTVVDFCESEEDQHGTNSKYVNLVDNPERFTGFSGKSSTQIWSSIYKENCFKPSETEQFLTSISVQQMCLEKRVFYRVISGLHAAINTHVAAVYPTKTGFPPQTVWSPNVQLFNKFFSPETTWGEGPSRLKNVYFNFLLVLRALVKAAPLWQSRVFHTGDMVEDTSTFALVQQLISSLKVCPSTFDESLMFSTPDSAGLRDEFRTKFMNISRILDCVGCDTCRLWGKLQVHGFGTAMKILFSHRNGDMSAINPNIVLTRNDVVALFNTFSRVAQALDEVEMFSGMIKAEARRSAQSAAPSNPSKPKLEF